MNNDDFTYCQGYNCNLRDTCLRYVQGKPVYDDFHKWMKNCNIDNREGYIKA